VKLPLARGSRGATRLRDRITPAVVQLTTVPRAVLFTGDVGGSFPYWYDPSRFESAARPELSLHKLARTVAANLKWYWVLAGMFALLCTVAVSAASIGTSLRTGSAMALLPALVLLGLYGITHIEGRLVGSAIVVALVMLIYLPAQRRRAAVVGNVLLNTIECLALAVVIVLAAERTSDRISRSLQEPVLSPARDLTRLGIRRGSRIGLFGSPYGQYWAHQSGIVIAAVRDGDVSPDESQLFAMATESCVRGVSLSAIVWPGVRISPDTRIHVLSNGWSLWKAPSPCSFERP
jgi:hypothetical protein